ncbi:3350_t:CDS:1, partial [Gigaspora rosea]
KEIVGIIEDKKTVVYDRYRNSYISQLHLDHGHLLSTVLKGLRMGSFPVIVGSRPPDDDEILT